MCKTYLSFRNKLLKLGQPDLFKSKGLKILSHLRLSLNHLNAHKFQRKFQSCLKPLFSWNLLCICMLKTESVIPFFLRCHDYINIRKTCINSLNQISDGTVTFLLFGYPKYGNGKNQNVITTSINHILMEDFKVHSYSQKPFPVCFFCIYSGSTQLTYVDASCRCSLTLKDYFKCSSCASMNICFYWMIVIVLFLLLHYILFI